MNDSHRLPVGDHTYYHSRYFIEDDTVPEYTHAPPAAYEAFRDIKYGIRIHWGVYCLKNIEASWPLLTQLDHAGRQEYQQLYKRFNPKDFSADKWMEFFQRAPVQLLGVDEYAGRCATGSGRATTGVEIRLPDRLPNQYALVVRIPI